MRRYSQVDEECIRAQTRVRDWTRAKLLDPSQCARLEAELRVDVRRTNDFLRAGLALFTGLIVAASVWLVVDVLNLQDPMAVGVATAVAALVCVGLAELLVGRLRFYRFGVEEALAVAAVALLSVSGAEVTATVEMSRWSPSMVVALLIGAAGGFGIYRRFGFVYAAVGGMACAALIPFQLHLSAMTRHIVAAATLAAVFLIVRSKRLHYQDEYPGDEYGQLQAAAWAGLYLALNVKLLAWDQVEGWFYWFTYVMTWLLPVVGLRLGIREKDRALLDVSLVMALVTLVTNKPYLGWPRHTWDPVLLGVFLMAIALVLRRWLSTGSGGERGGFTSARILSDDARVLSVLRAASAVFQPDIPSPRPDPRPPDFDGGRSGGGGGGATY
jgi:hypothetical protein